MMKKQILIFAILFMVGITANAQSANLKWYRAYQESVEFNARFKGNLAFTSVSAKANKKAAKKKRKTAAKKERNRNKIVALREEAANIRNNED